MFACVLNAGSLAPTGERKPERVVARNDAGPIVAVDGGAEPLARSDTPATPSPVEEGLRWIARHQREDGSWSAALDEGCGLGEPCAYRPGGGRAAAIDAALTGVAALALLGEGPALSCGLSYVDRVTGREVNRGDTRWRALWWLCKRTSARRDLRVEVSSDDAVVALALSEAYARTDAALYRIGACRALERVDVAHPCGDDATLPWLVLAIAAAQRAGLPFSSDALAGTRRWLGRVGALPIATPEDDASVPVTLRPALILWARHVEGLPAADRRVQRSVAKLTTTLGWPCFCDEEHALAAIAYRACSRRGGPIQALAGSQRFGLERRGDRCLEGSWDPSEIPGPYDGGRVLSTALAVLTLEHHLKYASAVATVAGR